jgi:hypothetical protein
MHFCRVIVVAAALAIPLMAQAQTPPGWQQTLQGLLTGNQGQDDALRQAYQRGYHRGRDDEARALQANDRNRRYDDRHGVDTRYSDEGYPGR